MKHDGHWHERQWQRIETEYQEPACEVVRVMHHEMKQPLHVIAGALGVCQSTLSKWCKWWNIGVRGQQYSALYRKGKVQKRARELGYDGAAQAIRSMRVSGLRWCDIQEGLDCAESTISRYLSPDFKGYHHISDEGREAKRENARKLNKRMENGEIERGGFAKWRYDFEKKKTAAQHTPAAGARKPRGIAPLLTNQNKKAKIADR